MTNPLGRLESVIFDDLFENARQETEKYNQELRAKAKSPEQLTVSLEGVIEGIDFYQGSVSFTPRSEMVIGGRSPSYSGGHVNYAEIKIQGESKVEKLKFDGWPHLEAGDTIRAYIFKGQKESEKCFEVFEVDWYHNPPSHWTERDYQPVEHPIKIEKLRGGKVIATYHNRL